MGLRLSSLLTSRLSGILPLTPSYYFSERNAGTESSKKLRDRYYNYTAAFKSDYKITDSNTLSLSAAYDRYDKYKYYVLLNEKEKRLWKLYPTGRGSV